MAKKPAEIQREIAQQRAAIERRLHALEDRVVDDVRDAGSAFTSEIGERTRINQYASERPLATVAGAFGAGVVLGMISDRRKGNGHRQRDGDGDDRGGGLLDEIVGVASGAIGSSVQTEVRQLIRDVLGTDERRDNDGLNTGAVGQVEKMPEHFRQ
jgi:ElaB/YqjD/DUF883 family membrane-anchored ribosome-binding protein